MEWEPQIGLVDLTLCPPPGGSHGSFPALEFPASGETGAVTTRNVDRLETLLQSFLELQQGAGEGK